MQLLTLGLLAELQARTYHESQGKPIYVVREIVENRAGEAPLVQQPRRREHPDHTIRVSSARAGRRHSTADGAAASVA